jgi:threonylcarbamoyladenosine tRNA methylthiotransferase MtaB
VRDLCIGTDILVGAPGESRDDFAETLQLLENSPVAYAHVFKYSERRNTAASRNPDKVDAREINVRSAQARHVGERKRKAYSESFVGRTVEVLFEQEENGLWSGYTGNYVRVAARSSQELTNTLRIVRLEQPQAKHVLGVLDDEPHHRD